jgi:hypothetical protein
MQDIKRTEQRIKLARKWGLWWLYLLLPSFILGILISIFPGIVLELINLGVFIFSGVSSIILLFGVVALAREVRNERLEKNVLADITLGLVSLPLLAFMYVPGVSEEFGALILGALVPILIAMGIVYIRMGTDFKGMTETWGETSRKTSKWSKLTGYFMVTILGMPLAGIFAAITGYYQHKLLKERDDRGSALAVNSDSSA